MSKRGVDRVYDGTLVAYIRFLKDEAMEKELNKEIE
jgi:hypothetical protein